MLNFILTYWLEFVLTLVSGAVVFILKKMYADIKRERDEQATLKLGMLALLHDSLFQNCEKYISRGEITVNELNNLEGLYTSYHSLGGNGTGTALYERCKNLDIKS